MTVVRNEEGQPTDVALDYTESYTGQNLLKFRKWFKNGLKAQKILLPFTFPFGR